MPIVTALYAGLLGLVAVAVAFPAGMLRGKLNISIPWKRLRRDSDGFDNRDGVRVASSRIRAALMP